MVNVDDRVFSVTGAVSRFPFSMSMGPKSSSKSSRARDDKDESYKDGWTKKEEDAEEDAERPTKQFRGATEHAVNDKRRHDYSAQFDWTKHEEDAEENTEQPTKRFRGATEYTVEDKRRHDYSAKDGWTKREEDAEKDAEYAVKDECRHDYTANDEFSPNWSPDSPKDNAAEVSSGDHRRPEEIAQDDLWNDVRKFTTSLCSTPGVPNVILPASVPTEYPFGMSNEALREFNDVMRVLRLAASTHSGASEHIDVDWQELFFHRSKYEPNSCVPIADPNIIRDIVSDWQKQWCATNLTEKQCKYKTAQKTSIFSSWLRRSYGSKHVVTGFLQAGVTWTSTAASSGAMVLQSTNVCGYLIWFERLFDTIAAHRSHPDTIAARKRSGSEYGKSGLTETERKNRDDRERARLDLIYAQRLETWFRTHGASEQGLSSKDRWYLHELRNGNLQRRLSEADSRHGGRVQASDFVCASTLE